MTSIEVVQILGSPASGEIIDLLVTIQTCQCPKPII